MVRKSGHPKIILFRCDGNKKTGLGHVSRCLALSEAMDECGFRSYFYGNFETGASHLLRSAKITFQQSSGEIGEARDVLDTIRLTKELNAEAIVLDSYQLDDTYVATLNWDSAPVLLIDDFGHLQQYECSALLNFTVSAGHLGYPCGNKLCMLGPGFLLARRRLRRLRQSSKSISDAVRRVLVAMGGVDRMDLSGQIVRILSEIDPTLSVHVVIGHDYGFMESLSHLLSRFRGESRAAALLPDLAEEFVWADVCVAGGGLTKYEAVYMGIPTAIMSQNSEQASETGNFVSKGLGINLERRNDNRKQLLEELLSEFITNTKLRESVSHTALELFPEDPTKRAAENFGALLGVKKGAGL
jgi:UDP-2,4-diacetamido-2,4,6-trideoxy-beta-L-altropyranose hydrolase